MCNYHQLKHTFYGGLKLDQKTDDKLIVPSPSNLVVGQFMGIFYMYVVSNLELGSRVAIRVGIRVGIRVAILAFWSNIKIDL